MRHPEHSFTQPARTQELILIVLLSMMVSLSTAACTRLASTAPAAVPTTRAYSISVVRVRVTQKTGIFILGESDLPDGNCILTELQGDGQNLTWWPADICIEVASGQWELLVPLGRRGAPAELDEGIQYQIHAWWSENPQATSIHFPFDLSGPLK